jgi:hypothetical protein
MQKRPTAAGRIAGAVKSLLPPALHAPARALWRRLYALADIWPETKLYLHLAWHRLTGRSYLRWYADTLDGWVESRDPEFLARKRAALAESGADDVAVLRGFGMLPTHTLHEYGCGQLRSALHFAEYLEPGNFSANDSSKGRIDLGMDLFGDRLRPRRPTLIVNDDNSFDWLQGRKFDFLWCHAVFGHMPQEDVEDTLRNLPKAMHADSVFYFTYDEPSLQVPDAKDEIIRVDARNWMQSFAFFERVAKRHGMRIEDVSAAIRPYPSYRSHICLARITLAPKG